MSFSPASLRQQLMRYPVPQRYCVAYSGGCDSHALLYALSEIIHQLDCSSLHTIHINHGLHPDADKWPAHCQNVCQSLGVSFEAINVSVDVPVGESTEARARDARYQAFENALSENDMLLLAHHQDDQAETLLLQLLRGAGVNGLAAMPSITEFKQGWLARPMLEYTRDEIVQFAHSHQLQWINDPSNQDTVYDRNYLRHEVFPLIKRRWPSASATIARAAIHQADAAALINDLAEQDYKQVKIDDGCSLSISELKKLSPERQVNIIRFWLKFVCHAALPDTAHMKRIIHDVINAFEDRTPVVQWAGLEMRRYRDELFVLATLPAHDNNWQANWDMHSDLVLPVGGMLITHETRGNGIRKEKLANHVTVGFRRGGEKCRLPGREHHHELKKLFQEWGVPPWLRDRVPLIFLDGELAQIVGYSLCEPFAAGPEDSAIEFKLQE